MNDSDKQSLERIRSQRAALADFGMYAFQSDDLDALLTKASQLVSEAMGIDLVKVLEHFPERGEMLMRAGVNWKPGVVGNVTFKDDEHSPGGYALKANTPVISADISKEKRFEIPGVLTSHGVHSMINVIIPGGQRPFGVLEVDARQRRDFDSDDIAFLQNYANLLAGAIERVRLHDHLSQSAREQNLLARELGHRVKNVLSVVQAITLLTTTRGRSARDFQEAVVGRIQALATAESLIFEDHGDVVDMRRIAHDILAPHDAGRPGAITMEGEPIDLPARKSRMLGLVIHELATNAAKYGALSSRNGKVRLGWQCEPSGKVTLSWTELDGPPVLPPGHKGFGSRLLEEVIKHELKGNAAISYPPAGLQYQLSFVKTQ
jgi:two-component sensor histidine kinase